MLCGVIERSRSGNILSKGVAVDTAHGNAKGPRLQDVVVGEALDQLLDAG